MLLTCNSSAFCLKYLMDRQIIKHRGILLKLVCNKNISQSSGIINNADKTKWMKAAEELQEADDKKHVTRVLGKL